MEEFHGRSSGKFTSDEAIKVTDPSYKGEPNYWKVAGAFFLIAFGLLIIVIMPKKAWQILVHAGRTIFAGGRHVPRPEGEEEIFPDS